MARKKTAAAARIAKTVSAAAEQLGVGERTLAAWLSRGCPGKSGAYDLDAIEAWRAANIKPRSGARENPERAKWEARRARAEALTKEIRLREVRGHLVSVVRAARVIRQHIAEVATHLDQLPDYAVALSQLSAEQKKQLRARIKSKVRELRTMLERSLRALAKEARSEAKHDEDEADAA